MFHYGVSILLNIAICIPAINSAFVITEKKQTKKWIQT